MDNPPTTTPPRLPPTAYQHTITTMPNSIWSSDRLVYRALESDDDAIIQATLSNAEDYLSYSTAVPQPISSTHAKDTASSAANLPLACIVCLADAAQTPIGYAMLFSGRRYMRPPHNGAVEIGLILQREYQGCGYGTEVLLWLLEWCFRHANYRRVEITASEHNTGAIRLYEKLGFRTEVVSRGEYWHMGRYWDGVEMAIGREEWRERYWAPSSSPGGIKAG
ncbi:hypothetical protein ANO11243_016810 [Dothideomycetidae sp. 11243]|nr:hypothetical protein ANO11243_016810 [fungal sp. No.11243]